jgi:hypothetical protein
VTDRIDPAGVLDTALTFVVEDGRIMRTYAIRMRPGGATGAVACVCLAGAV